MLSIAVRIFVGFILGAACNVLPVLLFGLYFSMGLGEMMEFALYGGILAWPFVLVAMLFQAGLSVLCQMKEYKYFTIGIWLIYPIAAVAFVGNRLYYEHRVAIAAGEDYSSREIVRPAGEIRNLLLVITHRERDGSGFYGGNRCMDACAAALRTGVLDSVAKPRSSVGERMNVFDGGFLVFRHASGEACHAAKRGTDLLYEFERANSRPLEQVEGLRRDAERNIGQPRERETRNRLLVVEEAARDMLNDYLEILAMPRIHPLAAEDLAARGYLDECITMSYRPSIDHDVRISYGSDLQRPYGPSQQVAEIHAFRDEEPYRVARFEYGRIGADNVFVGRPFTIAEIIIQVTGRSFDPELPGHPYESVEAELARLATLVEDGAYRSSSRPIAEWLKSVFSAEATEFQRTADGIGQWDVSLSADEIANLIRIAPTETAELRQAFFRGVSTYLDRTTIEAIARADAERN